ncbi:hypothetical protein CSW37_12115 [Thermus scotoductus]|uniref:Uncharacterized protein n=4 Tax=Thermus TaxID=270 RepID=A0A430S429_THESC|nr:hypothetical protein [Thermus scotoductus]ADW21121.1 conserved hypothetical protein [Thermus scotoductus SA-01]RTG92819.1 hypothetical protein CSW51_10300 [Thermus scotoductus]RTG98863.1 hypothetical protein CSW50_14420 [Thermus scotoductus]RTG99541.1 hypothetical protein CSW47_15735 [Thermus scotoductus]RTH20657.1 hypothetical protein CSW41_01820 [Thermus scotoductus]
MRKIRPIARRFPLTTPIDDRSEWQSLPLEERLEAVWEMALFWAELEREKARREGREAEIATDRLLPVARKRPLPKP